MDSLVVNAAMHDACQAAGILGSGLRQCPTTGRQKPECITRLVAAAVQPLNVTSDRV